MKGTLLGYAALAAGLAAIWGIEIYAIPWTDPYLTDILVRIGYTVLAVMGLALVLGFTGQFSLGQAGFMAVGAYVAAILTLRFDWPAPLSMLAGGIAAALAGLVVGVPSLRLSGDYLAIVTLGFNQIIIVAIQNSDSFVSGLKSIFGTPDETGALVVAPGTLGDILVRFVDIGAAQGLTGVPVATSFGITFTWVLLGAVFLRNLLKSAHGRTFAAVRDNEIATRSLGIDTTRVKVTAFVIGAFWAGIAGSLLGFKMSSIFPSQFEAARSIELLAMVVLGGTGSLSGPVLAAAVLTALPEALRGFADYRMILYALLLVVMMVVRPSGFLGSRELTDVFRALWRRVRPAHSM